MRNSLFIGGISLLLGLSFNYFFVEKVPGISFPLYVILILVGLFISSKFFNKRTSKEVLWLLAPLIFFSAMVFVRASILLTILNIAASIFLLLMIADIFCEGRLKSFIASDYIRIFFLPLMFLKPLFQTIVNLSSWKEEDANKRILRQVVRGIAISAPFLIIFIILFSSADLIFEKYLSYIITFEINTEIVFRLLLILIVTLAFIGAYSYIFLGSQRKSRSAGEHAIGFIEGYILLGSVNFLFLIFIALQLAYLFGGESNIALQGFTYAEYARRGFFELIAVAIVSFLLLFAAEKFTAKKDGRHALGFRILSTVLILEVILIMASAHLRLSFYETAYGFTILRLYSHIFIAFLAAIFSLLLYKIFWDGRENKFALGVFAMAVLFLTFMNFFNPDAFIARRNIEKFSEIGKLDIYYLNSLSGDALPESIKALEMPDEDSRKTFAREIYRRAQDSNSPLFSRWQSLNLSRIRAKKILDSRIADLEPYK